MVLSYNISKQVKYSCRPDLDKLAFKTKKLESKFIEIQRKNKNSIIVGCIYRHPYNVC